MTTYANLRDAHLHLAEHGESLSLINLADCGSVAECLERVAKAAAGMAPGAWVKTKGARIAGWREGRYPTAVELDEAAGGRAVVVQSFDHHAMSVSTAVLQAAGIGDRASGELEHFIERDALGVPTGVLLETACKAVWGAMPAATREDKRGHVLAAQTDLLAQGFVEVHDMLSTALLAEVLLELEREGKLALRVRVYATPEHLPAVERVFAEHCAGARVSPGGRVRLGGMKLFADGTLNSRTAAMLMPYAGTERERGGTGVLFFSTDQIAAHIAAAAGKGHQTAVHAIGDAAVRQVLDAYEHAGCPALAGAPALRIEHVQFLDEADVGRFAAMNVIASVQPCHLLTDIEAIRRFAPDRAGRAFAVWDLVESALAAGRDPAELVWLGSDAPVVRPWPGDNVQAAVQRRRAGMPEDQAVGMAQAIDEGLCLRLCRAG